MGVLPFNHIGPHSHGATTVGKEDLGQVKGAERGTEGE